jgi:hypothetical protein
MMGKAIIWSAAVVAIVAVSCVVLLRLEEQRRRVRQMPKVIASISYTLATIINENAAGLEEPLVKGDPAAWRMLDPTERRWLLAKAARDLSIAPEWATMVENDAWGNPLRFEVHRPPRRVELRITSAGRDAQFDTADDISCTTEETAPPELWEQDP